MNNLSKLAEVFGVKALDYVSFSGNNFWEKEYVDPAHKEALDKLSLIEKLVNDAEKEKSGSIGLYWQLIADLKEILGNAKQW